ncbi:hypothetical protein SAMN05444266_106275 [Chitinophaga jiangningensis]|uniref:Uncharacterized protein n=1 Tax=Chitinophaga jiangningensis TaxID=1419482 RepID=A0A1M7FTW5_9BACT|nr:hypothetical protein [Chitinophaga jiangningensis]SHM07511.1 hypothetical protein SAMN05444266_106275 [Chitinophaga jiangningensis]
MKKLLFTICILFPLLVHSQQRKLVYAYAGYDVNALPEIYNYTPIGIRLTFSDSTTQETTGIANGKLKWNKLTVQSSNGEVNNGILTFNRAQLQKDNYQVQLTVSLPGEAPVHTTLELPHLIGMRFNQYADSLKKNIRFYLNVEGQFSSDRILPLDTNLVRFKASAGQILGQDLLLPAGDTTRFIQVEAWYKLNPEKYLITTIPVKQLPDKD